MAVVRVTERVAVVPGGVNVGVLQAEGGRCVLVDTGLNDSNAKRTLKSVQEELGAKVVAILTTHAHADHFGGNATVVKRTGAKVFAPAVDEAILRYPLLQPALLFAGADPPDSMRGRFLLADPSPVDHVVQNGSFSVEGIDVTVVPLPGHSPNQVGYLVDGVFFCADVVLPKSILAKYKIPYLFSLTDHLKSLATARVTPASRVVPGHGPLVDSIGELCDMNQALLLDIIDAVLELAETPVTADQLLTGLLRRYQSTASDAASYYLLHPTVFAFLSHLVRTNQLSHEVKDGQSLWQVA